MLRRLFLIFGYFCGFAAIVGITMGLVAYGNDYSYDFATRSIIQKGHVIINSLPTGLRVTADGKLLNKKTPYQTAYKVGDHTFSLEKDGFWPWQKTLRVVAGRVALANYVIMVPKQPTETVLDSRVDIAVQAISKDHRHLAFITGGADSALYTLDLGNKKIQKVYTPKASVIPVPPATTPASVAEILRDVEWADDASHLLIVSDIGGVPQHRLATAGSSADPNDLTSVYGFNFTGVHFSGSNWRQLYWISPDGLRKLDIGSATVSGVLAEKVTQFWTQPDRVLYVQQTDPGRSLWSIDGGGKKQELIQALVESNSYVVSETRYNGSDELIVVPAKTGIATLYTGIYGDKPESKVLAKDISNATFSPDGRLLALSSTATISVYDIERSMLEQAFVMYEIKDQPGRLSVLTWFDENHLLANREGRLFWSEFDGANRVDLGKAQGIFPAYADPDNKAVIEFRPAEAGVKITQVQIRQ